MPGEAGPGGAGWADGPNGEVKPWPLDNSWIGRTASQVQVDVSATALVAAFGSKDVKVELDTLINFKKKVDALLASLEGSEAAQHKVKEQKLAEGNLGTGFSESKDLMAAYDKTHAAIAQLSKAFADQIGRMSAAVAQTAGTYGSNEEHQTAAVKAVAKNADTYIPAAGPHGPAPKQGGGGSFS
ncbi:hypothetical protein PUR61_34085 [Streptomyces sp. BE20]|uniref:hypothetical protein n=1 Tax=Streptomyces sp. BE20 TaxID=3002525 RepID=UPI002E792ACA|nr:hypothetical protein [Streptomyces sp. BE20]MEE1827182.1 hypothetical protein [Streptomyces sp. BE20]